MEMRIPYGSGTTQMYDSDNNAFLETDADANACPIELNNQPSPPQIRIMVDPFDSQLHNHVIFKDTHLSQISLSAL